MTPGRLHLGPWDVALDAAGVQELAALLPGDAPAWQRAIVACLEAWFDSSDTVSWTTSGSTGEPRPVRHLKSAVAASAARTSAYFRCGPGTRALCVLPAEFTGGAMFLIRGALHGWHVVALEPRAHPALPAGLRFDFTALTPHQAAHLRPEGDRLGTVLLGGAPSAPALAGPWPAGSRVYESFGMAETISHFAVRRLLPDPEPAFTCLPGTVVAERDGALAVTDAATGVVDLATRDAVTVFDGGRQFVWLGRLDDAINSGGLKLYPAAIEAALADLIPEPFIAVGRPHPELGSQVVLRIEAPADPERAAELLERSRERLPRHHAPRAVEWGVLPRTGSGKVVRGGG
jgi:O-succinylbenzoic acid--CoA ligase